MLGSSMTLHSSGTANLFNSKGFLVWTVGIVLDTTSISMLLALGLATLMAEVNGPMMNR